MTYNLTDYTLKELRVIQQVNQDAIEYCEAYINAVDTKVISSTQFRNDLKSKETQRLSILREHNVLLLTAIQEVKDRETVNQN